MYETQGRLIGYARVSKKQQDIEPQIQELKKVGCEIIYQESKSGQANSKRAQFNECVEQLRAGDVLVVTTISRLGRNSLEMFLFFDKAKSLGVYIRSLREGIDTRTMMGVVVAQLISILAEIETQFTSDRIKLGLQHRKEKGLTLGVKRKFDDAMIMKLYQDSHHKKFTMKQLMEKYKLSKATVWKYVKLAKEQVNAGALQ